MTARLGAMTAIWLVGINLLCAADWPTYMRDTTRVGHTAETLETPLVARWIHASAEPPELAWPGPGGKVVEGLQLEHRVRFDDVFPAVAAGDAVYFGSSVDNTVRCLDASSGEVRWQFVTGAPVRLAPTWADGKLYFGSDDGVVYCLDAQDGDELWRLRAGPRDERVLARGRITSRWPVRTGVLVDDGRAYFGAGIFPHETVYLYAVDAETGEIEWRNDTLSDRDAGRNDLTPQGYLLATQELLFVPSGRTLPAAVDRRTGELQHKQRGGGKQVGGSQAFLAEDHIFSVGEHHILALDQEAGSIDNRLRGRRMTLHGDQCFLADGKELLAIDRTAMAEFQQQRVQLEGQQSRLQRSLLANPATLQLQRVRQLQTAWKEAEAAERRAATLEGLQPDQLASLEQQVAARRSELAEATAAYEKSRAAYEERQRQLQAVERQIAEVMTAAILWRTEFEHASSMILAGETLVVGGEDTVVAVDTASGTQLWEHAVEGEARALAAASGRLFVSTTTGRVYGFETPRDGLLREAATVAGEQRRPDWSLDAASERWARIAREILDTTDVSHGYCLVLDGGSGRLAYALAEQSELKIYCVDADAERVAAGREALLPTGLYGRQITIDHADLGICPHPNYFANLIVSERLLDPEQGAAAPSMTVDPEQVVRHLKPHGGVLCLGTPQDADPAHRERIEEALQDWWNGVELSAAGGTLTRSQNWTSFRRGALQGAADWSHQYGNPGNTSSVPDTRVRGGLSVLWYGDPGPSKMLNRHVGAVGPISVAGRLFVQGDTSVMAYDAYNGVKLWELQNPGALRTGVFNNYEPGNLVATEETLFMVMGDHCLALDAATGDLQDRYDLPEDDQESDARQWGYVAHLDGTLIGTSTRRKLLAEESRRRGRPHEVDASDQVFAVRVADGQQLWSYRGESISHTTVAVDPQRVYFVDSKLSPEERERLLRQDKTELAKLTGEARAEAEAEIKRADLRRAVAVDLPSGEVVWSRPIDVTDCTGVGIGAGRLTLMAAGDYVVLCGANANGHYWDQFLKGDFQKRRLLVLNATTGETVWDRDANYRHRPIVIGSKIVAEPWAYELATGEQQMRQHPLTGELTPWKFIRPGHHCGAISATPQMMFYRSGFTAYYDLEADSGTRHFAGHRLGCWINTIPAAGLVMIPEASAGCACLFSLTSTVVLEPREERQVWGVYSAEGSRTPVQQMSLNLGGPGDRRDAHGKLWLSYPRPSSRAGLDLPLDIRPQTPFGFTGEYFQRHEESYAVAGTDIPWLFSSGVVGMTRCELPLLEEGQEPASYTVRLYFAAPEGDEPKRRTFSVEDRGRGAGCRCPSGGSSAGPRDGVERYSGGARSGDRTRAQIAASQIGESTLAVWCRGSPQWTPPGPHPVAPLRRTVHTIGGKK